MTKYFNLFEIALISIVSFIAIYFLGMGWTSGDIVLLIMDTIAAICGIFSVVLCAKGKKSGFLFGLANVVFYSVISFTNQYYGEVMLNTLFYIPMNIISYLLWNKKEDANHDVKTRALTKSQIVLGILGIAAVTYCYHLFLTSLGGAMTMLDGTTTVLSIIATALMAARYAEQWLCWIIIDMITVILWCFAGDPIMIVMWGAYTINAIYGYIIWLARSNKLNYDWAKKIAQAA